MISLGFFKKSIAIVGNLPYNEKEYEKGRMNMRKDLSQVKQIYVHGGTFHADDVFSVAFVQMINPDIEVVRGFDPPSDSLPDVVVADIGDGEFDHHAQPREARPNGVLYAAFGKLVRAYGDLLFADPDDQFIFDVKLVQPLDDCDNNGTPNSLARAIKNMNPNWNEDTSEEGRMKSFLRAVDLAKDVINDELCAFDAAHQAKQEVEIALGEMKDHIVVLEEYMPFQNVLRDTDAIWVVAPSLRGGWSATGVKTGHGENKVYFPQKWWGKRDEELACFVPGMRFCHASGFMATFDTKEAAIEACKISLK